MTSKEELVKLFKKGELGELLVRAFGGDRICAGPSKDSNFLIIFESNEKTPSVESIAKTVVHHYQSIGYEVRQNYEGNPDVFGAFILCYRDGIPECVFWVLITTHWQYEAVGDKHSSLRAVCEIID